MGRRCTMMAVVLVLAGGLLAGCEDKSEPVKPAAETTKPTATVAATAKPTATAAPTAKPKPPPPKPVFDPKVAIIGKWVGDGYTGVRPPGITEEHVKKLRFVIEKEHVIQATPGVPVSKKRYSVTRVEGRKVYAELQDVPGEMCVEVRVDGKLYMTDPKVKNFSLIYRRGNFDVGKIEATASAGKTWQPSPAELKFDYVEEYDPVTDYDPAAAANEEDQPNEVAGGCTEELPCKLSDGRMGFCQGGKCNDNCGPGLSWSHLDTDCHPPCNDACDRCMEGLCFD